jgi:hypothetical protein
MALLSLVSRSWKKELSKGYASKTTGDVVSFVDVSWKSTKETTSPNSNVPKFTVQEAHTWAGGSEAAHPWASLRHLNE